MACCVRHATGFRQQSHTQNRPWLCETDNTGQRECWFQDRHTTVSEPVAGTTLAEVTLRSGGELWTPKHDKEEDFLRGKRLRRVLDELEAGSMTIDEVADEDLPLVSNIMQQATRADAEYRRNAATRSRLAVAGTARARPSLRGQRFWLGGVTDAGQLATVMARGKLVPGASLSALQTCRRRMHLCLGTPVS